MQWTRANGKDLTGLKNSFYSITFILDILKDNSGSKILPYLDDKKVFENLNNISEIIEKSIKEEPSVILTDGNMIKEGYNEELDNLCKLKNNSQDILNSYIEEEKKEIPNTKP